MFPTTVTVAPPGHGPSPRGGAALAPGLVLYSGPAYVEPDASANSRREGHLTPEGVQHWRVFTPADPQAVTDSVVSWAGKTLVATGSCNLLDSGANVLWRTDCTEVA
jgi:hypothetical protein